MVPIDQFFNRVSENESKLELCKHWKKLFWVVSRFIGWGWFLELRSKSSSRMSDTEANLDLENYWRKEPKSETVPLFDAIRGGCDCISDSWLCVANNERSQILFSTDTQAIWFDLYQNTKTKFFLILNHTPVQSQYTQLYQNLTLKCFFIDFLW